MPLFFSYNIYINTSVVYYYGFNSHTQKNESWCFSMKCLGTGIVGSFLLMNFYVFGFAGDKAFYNDDLIVKSFLNDTVFLVYWQFIHLLPNLKVRIELWVIGDVSETLVSLWGFPNSLWRFLLSCTLSFTVL